MTIPNEIKDEKLKEKTETEEELKVPILEESYPLIPPFAYAQIKTDPKTRRTMYHVIEVPLKKKESTVVILIKQKMIENIDVIFGTLEEDKEKMEYLREKIEAIWKKEKIEIDHDESFDKVLYYVSRDFIGFGRLEPLLRDQTIEDISCDGVGIPIYIWHRKYESVPTNLIFRNEEELNGTITKIAQRSGRHISIANPILDASLPDGSRVQLTYGKEVTQRGSTFTIRKFRADPLTITDLLQFNTLNTDMAAYLWYLIENRHSALIAGGIASGKTTLLNTLSMFIRPGLKIVTIEDSVSADSEIWIHRNNKFERIAIGDLVDELFELYGFQNSGGYEVLTENPEDIKVFSMSPDCEVQLTDVSSFIRHRVTKQGIEIVTTSGRRIKVTKDHSLFTLSPEGHIIPIDADSLQIGSRIAVPRFLPFDSYTRTESGVVNLLQHLGELKRFYIEGEPIKRVLWSYQKFLIEEQGLNENTFKWRLRSSVISCEHLDAVLRRGHTFSSEEIALLSLRGRSGGARIPLIISITDRLLEIVGLWIAEGSYDINSILITGKSEEVRDIVHDFGRELGLTPGDHSDGVTLMLNSAILKVVFEKVLELTGHADTKRVPTWIFNLPNAKIAKVLKGLFSGDSYVGKHEIQYASQSIELLKDIQTLLLRFNIQACMPALPYERDKTYRLRISSVPQLDTFRTNIGYFQEYKTRALDAAAARSSSKHDITDTIPLSLDIIEQLKATTDKKFHFSSYENILQASLGRRYLQEIVSYLEDSKPHLTHYSLNAQTATVSELKLTTSVYQSLKDLAHSDLLWDTIKEIRWFKFDNEYVYDLSVPEAENFITENIVAHNTAELNIPHENVISSIARTGLGLEEDGLKRGSVTLFDLLKASLRQRPDFIIVGEIRGQEAYFLFQAMATGHLGMATMHGDSVSSVIHRLESKPMNIPRTMLTSLDTVCVQRKVRYGGVHIRRSIDIQEMVGMDAVTNELLTNKVYTWNAKNDSFDYLGRSVKLEQIAEHSGMTLDDLWHEIDKRKVVLGYMLKKGIRFYQDVASTIRGFYNNPDRMYRKAKRGMGM